jgi:hypothetical protein
MEITEEVEIKRKVEMVLATVCNRCGKNFDAVDRDRETKRIEISWGWPFHHDGEKWVFDLCEKCIEEIANEFVIPVESKFDPLF